MMEKYKTARRLFEEDDCDSETTSDSVIFISSDESEEMSDEWDSNWSTDTEDMIMRIETEVVSSPKLIAGSIMTSDSHENLSTIPGARTSRTDVELTPRLSKQYFDKNHCYAPAKECAKKRIELSKTNISAIDSPMSPLLHERGPILETPQAPLPQPSNPGSVFRTRYKTRRHMRT